MIDRINALAFELSTSPGVTYEVTPFASGAVYLDVWRDSRLFVLFYSPNEGFGVDEMLKNDGFASGYRYCFPDFESAAEKLRRLVDGRDRVNSDENIPAAAPLPDMTTSSGDSSARPV